MRCARLATPVPELKIGKHISYAETDYDWKKITWKSTWYSAGKSVRDLLRKMIHVWVVFHCLELWATPLAPRWSKRELDRVWLKFAEIFLKYVGTINEWLMRLWAPRHHRFPWIHEAHAFSPVSENHPCVTNPMSETYPCTTFWYCNKATQHDDGSN